MAHFLLSFVCRPALFAAAVPLRHGWIASLRCFHGLFRTGELRLGLKNLGYNEGAAADEDHVLGPGHLLCPFEGFGNGVDRLAMQPERFGPCLLYTSPSPRD